MGDPLGSGQEMDKTVRSKVKADNASVCGVPGRYNGLTKDSIFLFFYFFYFGFFGNIFLFFGILSIFLFF